MSKEDLLKKITAGIQKSGFPLELKIGSILEKNGWGYSIGNIYMDFETGIFRESDISASKTINGIAIHLFIECKKSEDKPIVLYAPKKFKIVPFMNLWLKIFPKINFNIKNQFNPKSIYNEFSGLNYFNMDVQLAKNLLVTKGDRVTQENLNYLSSINGLIKKSVYSGCDGYLETDFRTLFLYVFIFEGYLYQLTNSKVEDFDLTEIEYGQYEYEQPFQFLSYTDQDVMMTADKLGSKFIIEVMNPEYFIKYLNQLENIIKNIDSKKLEGWGENWPEFKK
jgi:hypothetical protein